MKREAIDPVVEMVDGPGREKERKETHPAYGQVAVTRRSGGNMTLYGSDFRHNHTIALTIRASELHRNLSSDWHYARQELVEVIMSEAQWASLVSSLNTGMGTPCTISHVMNEHRPAITPAASRADQFGAEMVKTLDKSIERIREVEEMVEGLKLSAKAKKDLMMALRVSRENMAANIKFVAASFDEHMEESVEKAKSEIDGYLTNVVQRAGLTALGSAEVPLSIEFKEVTDEAE